MPLIRPFRTSFGTEHVRDVLLVKAETTDGEGWAECATEPEPLYSAEYTDAAEHVLEHHLIPRLFAANHVTAPAVATLLAPVKGHRMAKAAVETALLDAELRAAGLSLGAYLGAVRGAVDCGVSVGITGTVDELLEHVAGYVDDGYRRVKLKIEPGWDLEPVAAVRARWPDLPLQVDANTAYRVRDAPHLGRLDELRLLLIEQPLADDDLVGHAELAKILRTPICLDESIVSAAVAESAIRLGACSIVNVKPARVGGYLEARRVHDICATHGIPVWCGGMLETGVGRAANLALAALPNFTLPGDTSASARYYEHDITEPFVLDEGRLPVPTGPGIGVTPLSDVLAEVTTVVRAVVR
ncbi:MAG: o-succinylbenzoate synthase [Actinobacteria bacterium]|nr:MAG: o-succinylbenzoate synthase [Actinomycetota bacterium]